MAMLNRLVLEGFKSIREMDLELRPLNVLIGANGAGKSNLVSFFKMIGEMAAGRLQSYIAESGRAQSMLFFGSRETTRIELARMEFEDDRVLFQPEAELPKLIVVDEPELGLHTYALNLVASFLKSASHHTQVLISTQSSSFLDHFESDDIIIVDRQGKESVFRRPDPAALEAWLSR